ncbi:AglZ/HisF2 family acetamidino modification protein [Pseudochryseolinea flava]|uniref:imidazole glycerol-phosphate synthase n=1 Tax=Pseudochryseolinea flava TaxID=2059302 RepID=A0A364XZK3_9BACT|nr:AglZ/HisF2 family acetamidino modification protein [Pseudochryseolinea flava]RAV99747.1 imidazole glycerol phosphate synthase subunit HisF [Pseudochryseolinea flava]
MALPRLIPVLLLKDRGLIKTTKFQHPVYIGDPVNAVKIFNEKEVDELIILDVNATRQQYEPRYGYLREIVSECFSPLAYGGGVRTVDHIKRLIQSGVEKIVINTACCTDPLFLKRASADFGSSTIVAAMDVKKSLFGKYSVYASAGTKNMGIDPVAHAVNLQQLGAGEIFLNNIDLDGTMKGYDHALIKKIVKAVDIPVIVCGGAADHNDLFQAINVSGASAAAAGSIFVFQGKHRGVLITYPEYTTIRAGLTS